MRISAGTLCGLLVLAAACEQAPIPGRLRRQAPRSPRVKAKVLTVRTNLLPQKQAFLHLVILSEKKIRFGNDADQWRLFDLEARRITYVDDIAKTFRSESFDAVISRRRAFTAAAPPFGLSPLRIRSTGARRSFGPFEANQHVIEMGAFRRELWLSTQELTPPELFLVWQATEPLNDASAGIMRDVFRHFQSIEPGFPVLDRIEMPYAGQQQIVERKLEKIEERNVPVSWVTVPAEYKNLDAR